MPTDYIGNDIAVKGYILPHKNNFSSEIAYKMLREYMVFLLIKDFMYIEEIDYCLLVTG